MKNNIFICYYRTAVNELHFKMSSLDIATPTTDSIPGTSFSTSPRTLRSTNKESFHKTNRRVISKPKKRNGYSFDIKKNEKEIKNFYLNKRLGKQISILIWNTNKKYLPFYRKIKINKFGNNF